MGGCSWPRVIHSPSSMPVNGRSIGKREIERKLGIAFPPGQTLVVDFSLIRRNRSSFRQSISIVSKEFYIKFSLYKQRHIQVLTFESRRGTDCSFSSTMQVPRWRNVQLLKISFTLPTSTATPIACFHSTPSLCEKWRSKWSSDVNKGQEPSKNHITYATRQKRADTKKALKNLLYNSGSSKFSSQNNESLWNLGGRSRWSAEPDEHSNCFDKKSQPKSSARFAGKSNIKKIKQSFSEDFDDQPETVFQATFGNKWYTWSFASRNDSFQRSSSGFEWESRKANERHADSECETEFGGDSCAVGSPSDRTILGLPPRGPLRIEQVKKAFHSSALKWHPGKHQEASQAMAEEKFKVCVNAYKSLCSALSPTH